MGSLRFCIIVNWWVWEQYIIKTVSWKRSNWC